MLTERVRSVRGLAHYHLPVDAEDDIAHVFRPLFDAVVELRVADGRPQQRWSLVDGPSSDWLPLEE